MDSHSKVNMNLNNTYGHRDRSSPSGSELKPTTTAAIYNTKDALLLVQRCIEGRLFPILRRPHDRERLDLVKAGNVFVYNEADSGIKRWTDGINWSPSRILNNFLVYRELDKAFAPGEKKKATKRPKRYSPYDRNSPGRHQHSLNETEEIFVADASRKLTRDEERKLVGSLNDSYHFKVDGLIKKTFSINFHDHVYHVVWYFSYLSFIDGGLSAPSDIYPHDIIYPEFVKEQSFRVQIDQFGDEQTGPTRDRSLRSSSSRSPPLDQDVYQQNEQLGRYPPAPAPGYVQYQAPTYQFNSPLGMYPHQRTQESNYSIGNYYPENAHNTYTPQEPRSYAGHSTHFAPQPNEYADSLHQQAQMPAMTSPHRMSSGHGSLYFPSGPSETLGSPPTNQHTRLQSGMVPGSAMQHLTARAEDMSGAYLGSSTFAHHNGAPSEYDSQQAYQMSVSPVHNTGLMNNAVTRNNERTESIANNGSIPGPVRGHINRGYNPNYYPRE